MTDETKARMRDFFLKQLGIAPTALERYTALGIRAADDEGAKAAKDGEILVYGPVVTKFEADIMREWFGIEDMVTNEGFRQSLNGLEGDVMLRVNSPGGDVWEASGIVNAIVERRNAGDNVDAVIDGLAASAGSLISSSAGKVRIAQMGTVMIHEAWTWTAGNKRELRETADFLEKIDVQAAGLYGERMGMSAADVAKVLEAETWYTADEAVDVGLADEMIKPPARDAGNADDAARAKAFHVARQNRLAAMFAGA